MHNSTTRQASETFALPTGQPDGQAPKAWETADPNVAYASPQVSLVAINWLVVEQSFVAPDAFGMVSDGFPTTHGLHAVSVV
ncbi:hypothetical protein V7S43_002269 [Phytophthora oleae]|uniref:Uncharacterized protein n=1 Tax=Phytophthora oleae TaxID=2107226 RepID=A0ABD3G4S2_9STRA